MRGCGRRTTDDGELELDLGYTRKQRDGELLTFERVFVLMRMSEKQLQQPEMTQKKERKKEDRRQDKKSVRV